MYIYIYIYIHTYTRDDRYHRSGGSHCRSLFRAAVGCVSLSERQRTTYTQFTAGGGVHIESASLLEKLLETVKCKCEGSWRAGVFFYDELASALITSPRSPDSDDRWILITERQRAKT